MTTRDWLATNRVAVCWSIVGLGVVVWIGWNWLNRTTVKGEPPVESITFDGSTAMVVLSPETAVEDSVSMDHFCGAYPEMKDEERTKLLGKVIQIREVTNRRFTDEYWFKGTRFIFHTPEYTYGREDGVVDGSHKLSVFPPNVHFEKFFCEQISKHLRGRSVTRVLILFKENGSVRMAVKLDGVRVDEVSWYQ